MPIAVAVAVAGGCEGDPPAPAVIAFSSSASAVTPGEKVMLSWTVANAHAVSISAAPGGPLVELDTASSGVIESKAISTDTTFDLVAFGEDEHVDMGRANVIVNRIPEILRFEATPNPAPRGGSTIVSWETRWAATLELYDGPTEIFRAGQHDAAAPPSSVATGSTSASIGEAASVELTLKIKGAAMTVMQQLVITTR